MAEIKTKANDASVSKFLDAIPDPRIRKDSRTLVAMMRAVTKAAPRMWGAGIVGFGTRTIAYAGGREADWMAAGFAPRKDRVTLYVMGGLDRHAALLGKLGPHTRGSGCLHIKRLEDVHLPTLEKIVRASVKAPR